MTLTQALDEFHNNPTSTTALAFNKAIIEYHNDGMIGKDDFNQYFEEVAMFLLITDPIVNRE